MKYVVILFLLLIPFTLADTTFFDNPDDTFIMSSSPTGRAVIEETTDGTTSGGGCSYKWNCTGWSKCLPSGKQIRNCINIGTCLDTYKIPETEQNCTYTSSPKSEEEEKEKYKEKTIWEEIVNKPLTYVIMILIILLIIIYLNKNYFKKLTIKIKLSK